MQLGRARAWPAERWPPCPSYSRLCKLLPPGRIEVLDPVKLDAFAAKVAADAVAAPAHLRDARQANANDEHRRHTQQAWVRPIGPGLPSPLSAGTMTTTTTKTRTAAPSDGHDPDPDSDFDDDLVPQTLETTAMPTTATAPRLPAASAPNLAPRAGRRAAAAYRRPCDPSIGGPPSPARCCEAATRRRARWRARCPMAGTPQTSRPRIHPLAGPVVMRARLRRHWRRAFAAKPTDSRDYARPSLDNSVARSLYPPHRLCPRLSWSRSPKLASPHLARMASRPQRGSRAASARPAPSHACTASWRLAAFRHPVSTLRAADAAGAKRMPGATRPLGLENTGIKALCSLIARPLSSAAAAQLPPTQRGFLPGRSTTHNLLDIGAAARAAAIHHSGEDPVLFAFDVAAAFPTLARAAITATLHYHGLSDGTRHVVLVTQRGVRSTCRAPRRTNQRFKPPQEFHRGVHSSSLFLLAALRLITDIVPGVLLVRAYTGDLAEILASAAALRSLARPFAAWSQAFGLHLRLVKSVIVPLDVDGERHPPGHPDAQTRFARHLATLWCNMRRADVALYLGMHAGPEAPRGRGRRR